MQACKKIAAGVLVVVVAAAGGLLAWQLSRNPWRGETTIAEQMLGEVSRMVFGERCLRRYRIEDRSGAIQRAKAVMAADARTWIDTGNARAYNIVFNSPSFIDGGVAWKTGASDGGTWSVDFRFEIDDIRADLVVEMSSCGRVVESLHLVARK